MFISVYYFSLLCTFKPPCYLTRSVCLFLFMHIIQCTSYCFALFFFYFHRFEDIIVVRNGGTHGDITVNFTVFRNASDHSPVTDDLSPAFGVLRFLAGQMTSAVSFNITQDDLPEEAEVFFLRLLPDSVKGGAEVDEPMEVCLLLFQIALFD